MIMIIYLQHIPTILMDGCTFIFMYVGFTTQTLLVCRYVPIYSAFTSATHTISNIERGKYNIGSSVRLKASNQTEPINQSEASFHIDTRPPFCLDPFS